MHRKGRGDVPAYTNAQARSSSSARSSMGLLIDIGNWYIRYLSFFLFRRCNAIVSRTAPKFSVNYLLSCKRCASMIIIYDREYQIRRSRAGVRERGNEGERKDRVGGVVRATRTTASKGLRRIHSVRAPPNGGGLDPRRVRRVARWIRRYTKVVKGVLFPYILVSRL